jgi:hypothetical protein
VVLGLRIKPRIMISYRRTDSGAITGRIYDRLLARYGRRVVFMDVEDIPIGVDFRNKVDDVLRDSNVLLAIIGPNWLGPSPDQNRLKNYADPVRIEIETALDRNLPIVPVLVHGAQVPSESQLPETMREVASRNAVVLDQGKDFDIGMSRLIGAIDTLAGPRYLKFRGSFGYKIGGLIVGLILLLLFYVKPGSDFRPKQELSPTARTLEQARLLGTWSMHCDPEKIPKCDPKGIPFGCFLDWERKSARITVSALDSKLPKATIAIYPKRGENTPQIVAGADINIAMVSDNLVSITAVITDSLDPAEDGTKWSLQMQRTINERQGTESPTFLKLTHIQKYPKALSDTAEDWAPVPFEKCSN